MSFSLSISVKGVKGAQDALSQFPESIDELIKTKLEEIAIDTVTEMQSLVPVDTGALQDSIGYDVTDEGTLNFVAEQDYAGFVEYGTGRQEPQPYFNPPIDKLRSQGLGDDLSRDALGEWEKLVRQYKDQ